MNQLHLIQHSYTFDEFERLFARYADKNDKILFLDSALDGFVVENFYQKSQQILNNNAIYAMVDQVQSRGIFNRLDGQAIRLIGYPEFVDLSLDCSKTISW